jgi:hypothetical protein
MRKALYATLALVCSLGCSGEQPNGGTSTGGAAGSGGDDTSADAQSATGGAANGDSGSGGEDSDGSSDAGQGGGEVSAGACEGASPIHVSNGPMSSPEDTGFDMCKNTWVARRRIAKACPLGPTTTQACNDNLCSSDADCTQSPHGFCAESRHLAGYCGCFYGCMQDSDCDPGYVCFCGDPVGHCVPSTCVDDSSCGAGKLCASYLAPCTPGQGPGGACTGAVNGCFSGFACQSAADECLYDDDCLPGNARCELQGDHRVCAPSCPGPPPPQ